MTKIVLEKATTTERVDADMRPSFSIGMMSLALGLASCSGSQCQNEALDRVASPDGKLSAVVFSRNCGATTGDNIQVSVAQGNDDPTGKGNGLIVDQSTYSAADRPVWRGNRHLILTVPSGARVFLKSTSAEGVAISVREQ